MFVRYLILLFLYHPGGFATTWLLSVTFNRLTPPLCVSPVDGFSHTSPMDDGRAASSDVRGFQTFFVCAFVFLTSVSKTSTWSCSHFLTNRVTRDDNLECFWIKKAGGVYVCVSIEKPHAGALYCFWPREKPRKIFIACSAHSCTFPHPPSCLGAISTSKPMKPGKHSNVLNANWCLDTGHPEWSKRKRRQEGRKERERDPPWKQAEC